MEVHVFGADLVEDEGAIGGDDGRDGDLCVAAGVGEGQQVNVLGAIWQRHGEVELQSLNGLHPVEAVDQQGLVLL